MSSRPGLFRPLPCLHEGALWMNSGNGSGCHATILVLSSSPALACLTVFDTPDLGD